VIGTNVGMQQQQPREAPKKTARPKRLNSLFYSSSSSFIYSPSILKGIVMGIGYVRLCLYCIHTYISAAGEGSSVHWLPAVYKARLEEQHPKEESFFSKI
jgi:hypothetical protein